MNRVTLVSVIALISLAAGICQADSLVITYRSGKTQTVILDEPSQAIASWQFLGTVVPPQSKKTDEVPSPTRQEQVQKKPAEQPQAESKPAEKAPEKKSGVRVKWNAKPIRE